MGADDTHTGNSHGTTGTQSGNSRGARGGSLNTSPLLEIVGDGSCREEWKALATDLGVGDRVVFHGYVSEEELLAAYGRCDIFCMPGVAELQSLVTLEAMAAGKPVVAADAMALPHLVHPGENGYLYTPGNVAQLRDHLAFLVGDPAIRERYGKASQQIVAHHSFAQTLDRFCELYSEVSGLSAVASSAGVSPVPSSAAVSSAASSAGASSAGPSSVVA